MTAIEKRLGARFVDGLCKFKGSYSRFRRAPPKPGDLKESDRDVGSVAARVSMFANMNDHEAVELFRELDGPPLFDEYGEELQFWQIKPVSPPKRYQVARGTGEKGAALASTVQLDPDGDVQEQLRQILVDNAVRVIDLFRDWDDNGDGKVSKKEFFKAMRYLGLGVPQVRGGGRVRVGVRVRVRVCEGYLTSVSACPRRRRTL